MTAEEYAALQVGDEVVWRCGLYVRLVTVTRRTPKTVRVTGDHRVRAADIRRPTDADRLSIRLEQARNLLRRHDFVGRVDDASTLAFADELRAMRERWRALGGR